MIYYYSIEQYSSSIGDILLQYRVYSVRRMSGSNLHKVSVNASLIDAKLLVLFSGTFIKSSIYAQSQNVSSYRHISVY